VEQFYEQQKQ
jgi:hypothetical protein